MTKPPGAHSRTLNSCSNVGRTLVKWKKVKRMVMSEARENNRNGKRSRGSSPSTNNNNVSSKPLNPPVADDLTPETSDDDSRKPSSDNCELAANLRFGKSFQTRRKISASPRTEKANLKVSWHAWAQGSDSLKSFRDVLKEKWNPVDDFIDFWTFVLNFISGSDLLAGVKSLKVKFSFWFS